MSLLSDDDRQVVQSQLAVIDRPVKLLFFTQTIGAPETAPLVKQLLDELATLSEHVSVEEVNVVLEQERAARHQIEHIPAIAVLRGDEDTGIRFLGAPAGYEFVSLLQALVLAGGEDSGLSAESKALIAEHVTGPIDVKVFVTPT